MLNGYLRLSRDFFGIPKPAEGNPDVGIVGVPYDLTSSHTPGARFGPDAIRKATDSERSTSFPLALADATREMEPLSRLLTLEDVGDLEVSLRLPEAAAVDMAEAAALLAKSDSRLVFLGGDHFITYPLLRGLKRGKPAKYGLIYFDAHADFYEDMGGYQLSHASTVRRIVADNLVTVENIAAFDLRSAVPEQRVALSPASVATPVSADEFKDKLNEIADRIDYFYLSFDLDVFDPPLVPGVSHPESGGPDMKQIISCLDAAFRTRKVGFADIVELNPLLDQSGITEITARDVLKEILFGFSNSK
jgi:agmatinase